MGAVTVSNGTYHRRRGLHLVADHRRRNRPGLLRAVSTAAGHLKPAKRSRPLRGLRIPIGPPNLELYGIVGARWFGTKLTLNTPVFGFGLRIRSTRTGSIPSPASTRITGSTTAGSSTCSATSADGATARPDRRSASVGYNWTRQFRHHLGLSRALHLRKAGERGETAASAACSGCTAPTSRSSTGSEAPRLAQGFGRFPGGPRPRDEA